MKDPFPHHSPPIFPFPHHSLPIHDPFLSFINLTPSYLDPLFHFIFKTYLFILHVRPLLSQRISLLITFSLLWQPNPIILHTISRHFLQFYLSRTFFTHFSSVSYLLSVFPLFPPSLLSLILISILSRSFLVNTRISYPAITTCNPLLCHYISSLAPRPWTVTLYPVQHHSILAHSSSIFYR